MSVTIKSNNALPLVVRDQNSLQRSPKNSECLVSLVVEEVQDSIQYLVH